MLIAHITARPPYHTQQSLAKGFRLVKTRLASSYPSTAVKHVDGVRSSSFSCSSKVWILRLIEKPDTFGRRDFYLSTNHVVSSKKKLLYHQLHLHANDPNPFNRQTRIEYGLPQADHVRLTIYAVLSRALTLLVNERKEVGLHAVV